jgi:hypothetical protein
MLPRILRIITSSCRVVVGHMSSYLRRRDRQTRRTTRRVVDGGDDLPVGA